MTQNKSQVKRLLKKYELRFPSYQWWGIVSLFLLMSMHLDPRVKAVFAVQIASTIFVVLGLFRKKIIKKMKGGKK